MSGGMFALFGAVVLSGLYAALFCYRSKGLVSLLVKTGSTALLAVWAYLSGGPGLLVAALALSSLGDLFLAKEEERWLMPGMAAFFAAHVAYVILFFGLEAAPRGLLNTGAQLTLVFGGAFFVRWLSPWLGKMRPPVFAYAIVILVMGAAALRLDLAYLPVILGAIMFITSDMILSLQLFKKPADQPAGIVPSLAVWDLYFFGQLLIAWGVLNPLA